MASKGQQEYYRRDQKDGITAPNLAKCCSYAEHIVSARGKRDQYTSVSLAPNTIRIFGEQLYRLLSEPLLQDGHDLVTHERLLTSLREVAVLRNKAQRARSIQALRYAKKRKEGLIEWKFATQSVPAKDLITWTHAKVQQYFQGVA
jgi:hypothetical protein